jgi:L-galactono-1,4-lactone dehydrogenase
VLLAGGALLGTAQAQSSKSEMLVSVDNNGVLQLVGSDGDDDETVITNWSGTHSVTTNRFYQVESTEQLEQLIAKAHEVGQKIRVVGSALSPNGLGLSKTGMVNLGLCDKVLAVDRERAQVTVQAGARVAQVVDALEPHGLTLQNYASIAEQQLGGFVQVVFFDVTTFAFYNGSFW